MKELLKVTYNDDRPTVSARELHEFLNVGIDFRHWFPRMCEYGFTEGLDYTPVIFDYPQNHQLTTDFALTIEMGKELCMLQRNGRGKQARQYFIWLENDWNSPEKVMARALKIANSKINQLENKVEQDAPKVLFADAVAASNAPMLIGELVEILKQNGVDMGEKRLFQWMRDNGYLIKQIGIDFNAPTQKAMELSLFEVKETVITHSDGLVTINYITKVTGKGQQYFINKFLDKREVA